MFDSICDNCFYLFLMNTFSFERIKLKYIKFYLSIPTIKVGGLGFLLWSISSYSFSQCKPERVGIWSRPSSNITFKSIGNSSSCLAASMSVTNSLSIKLHFGLKIFVVVFISFPQIFCFSSFVFNWISKLSSQSAPIRSLIKRCAGLRRFCSREDRKWGGEHNISITRVVTKLSSWAWLNHELSDN